MQPLVFELLYSALELDLGVADCFELLVFFLVIVELVAKL